VIYSFSGAVWGVFITGSNAMSCGKELVVSCGLNQNIDPKLKTWQAWQKMKINTLFHGGQGRAVYVFTLDWGQP
jgi:hypothetical protein